MNWTVSIPTGLLPKAVRARARYPAIQRSSFYNGILKTAIGQSSSTAVSGWHTAAGLFAMGAEGIVLDNQLYLAEEAPLAPVYKDVIRQLEEKDATIIGQSLKTRYHFFAKLGTRIIKTLRDREIVLAGQEDADATLYREIETHMTDLRAPSDTPLQSLFYLGQDAVFARHFARLRNDR